MPTTQAQHAHTHTHHLLGPELEHLDLDQRVLLRHHTLAGGAVVVGADLPVQLTEDGGPVAELDVVLAGQVPELPLKEEATTTSCTTTAIRKTKGRS
jgi:hypothetical protein